MSDMVIKPKSNVVMVQAGDEKLIFSTKDFEEAFNAVGTTMEFRTSDVYVLLLMPAGPGQINMTVLPLDKHPMYSKLGLHTLNLTKAGIVWYNLDDDSPIVEGYLKNKSGIVVAKGIQ